ncbi:bifunctional diaminohydroxyphosphoribosylaminopyrimidine deaminase/5-amino-6-(5-phosphoribosylamino)uracil reductase RibD [Rhizobium sp. S153]|uniref:Riboflavin biosynthesis protein RibD n=1 Tax=Ciceribacter sichuanensis TaxID=2949647 RepID=A0ABT0V2H3_9HYPH|nr:bifunctional diaminohydroxyphosphoribosylaminopyrimidine deaminase/5-amino-6-(5-phosphoribosylamino)uracil reductase RibD [Ciceribacter sp. S153]MCM2400080.1 bifunctional diaminohydroxyphosphoribosylaminopyrimidine deaminase/5-amino-6-(5-phosphoribosylamino)uracil reductase RibD [Ciceribacter sp. S153]
MAAAPDDERFMAAAIRLSRWNLGRTSTNPSVGCVIVRDGVIVGRGVTAEGGRPHAEPQALADAGEKARGATAYVTLEPCSHHGKTPPCAEALIASGVARVVVSVTDPDERVSGRGLRMLEAAGIEVESGILEEEGRKALAGYLTRQTKARPQVILKLAVSQDGMIGREVEGQVAITGPLARAQVQMLRAEIDGILVGIGTALADDPELTVRLPGLQQFSPTRIVLDRRLELPLGSKLVKTANEVPVICISEPGDDDALSSRRDALRAAGVEVLQSEDLGALLFALAARGISSLLVEGGAHVAKSFLDLGLVDEVWLFRGDVVVGMGGIPSPVTPARLPPGFVLERSLAFGPDRLEIFRRPD